MVGQGSVVGGVQDGMGCVGDKGNVRCCGSDMGGVRVVWV